MKKNLVIMFVLPALLLSACRNDHFISDAAYLDRVESRFQQQRDLAAGRSEQLFSVFDRELSTQEEEALKFLYAYMPLSDLADYDGDFFLANVRASLEARDSFNWGKSVPEEIFRHFVLPVRVNNEIPDSSRRVFMQELKPRLSGMNMKEAALEVNHWCHEKVTYKSTDARTSSPLALVLTSWGRCGEESTFTVAAMRSVGIPARQCYTPRWAHCDDNHAWVEVWVDGGWHYLGACEPEHDLDIGWFSDAARRAMMVATNVYGDYNGPEEVLFRNEYYTRINLLANYAPVKTVAVRALNTDGSPADSAEVEFCLYNYAEFFPIARKFADKDGWASFTTGLGDLLVWVNNGKDFGFAKLSVGSTDTLEIRMGKDQVHEGVLEFDFVPPVERPLAAKPDQKLKAANSLRLQQEDSIRNDYMATFADTVYARELAAKFGLNADSTVHVMMHSQGNWGEIQEFIEKAPAALRHWVLPMLYTLSEKDLRDVRAAILLDHLEFSGSRFDAMRYPDRELFTEYVLCPRIAHEQLKEYKNEIVKLLGKDTKEVSADFFITLVKENIRINETANYYRVPLSPRGSMELRVADKHSRDILFVAVCRSFGIPARIEVSTKKPQYFDQEWKDVNFEKADKAVIEKKDVEFFVAGANKDFRPVYNTHYTIGVFRDGKYRSLDYENAPEVSNFPFMLSLEPGSYWLVTGNRTTGGSVLASIHFFRVSDDEQKIAVALRENPEKTEPLGNIKTPLQLTGLKGEPLVLPATAGSKGTVLIWIEPDKEPTKHVIAEIVNLKAAFEQWEGSLVFVLAGIDAQKFDETKYSMLPRQSLFARDNNYSLLSAFEKATQTGLSASFPVVTAINENGEITFLSSGYRIGTAEQLLKTLRRAGK